MIKNFYWFNLPTSIKEKLSISDARAAAIPCITQADFNSKVTGTKWYRLPEKLQAMVDQINSESTIATDALVGLKVNWTNVVSTSELLYAAVQTGTLCV